MRVSQREVEIGVVGLSVFERPAGQAQHASNVAGRERNTETVRRCVWQSLDTGRPEVVVLPLLAIGDDGEPVASSCSILSRTAHRPLWRSGVEYDHQLRQK